MAVFSRPLQFVVSTENLRFEIQIAGRTIKSIELTLFDKNEILHNFCSKSTIKKSEFHRFKIEFVL